MASPTPVRKLKRVVFSSADRDVQYFPTPAKYTIEFDEPFQEVAEVALIRHRIPFPAYQISDINACLRFRYMGGDCLAYIARGDYYNCPDVLASTVASAMSGACAGEFHVTYSPVSDSFTFSTVKGPGVADFVDFELLFASGPSASDALGFSRKNYASRNGNLVAEFRRGTAQETIVLRITGCDVNISTNNAINKSFAVFVDGESENFDDAPPTKKFWPPLGKLDRMQLSFTDTDGNAYDFQNQDHFLEFQIVSMPRYQANPDWIKRAL